MEVTEIKYFIEAALLAAARPLSLDQISGLFDEASTPEKKTLREAIEALQEEYAPRGIEIAEVASGFRMQVKPGMAERLERLWEERPPRYSRALFETLALIAYRQPMTRGEIEEVRGVSVSSNIIRSLLEREWIRVVGHRDVPGRPAMFGTTRQFLDYFGLKKLDELPPLADLADWESLRVQLNLPAVEEDEQQDESDEDTEERESAVVTQLPVNRREPQAEDGTEAGDESGDETGDESDDAAGDEISAEEAVARNDSDGEANEENDARDEAVPSAGDAADAESELSPVEAADGDDSAAEATESESTVAEWPEQAADDEATDDVEDVETNSARNA